MQIVPNEYLATTVSIKASSRKKCAFGWCYKLKNSLQVIFSILKSKGCCYVFAY